MKMRRVSRPPGETAEGTVASPTPLRRGRTGRSAGRAFAGLFAEVRWTLGFVGLLLYVFSIVTYRLPLATPAMLMAIAGVFMGREKVRMPAVLVVFGVFILWAGVGYTQTAYGPVVWEQLVLFGKLWLIAFAAVNTIRTPAQIRFFIVFFLVCFATHPARGAIFNYLAGHTVFGRALWNHIYANPNDLAGLTLLPLALAIALIKDVDAWVRRGALVSVVVLAALILMTQSRGGFLALGLMALLVWQTQRRKLRALVGVVVLGTAAVAIAPSGVWERVSGLSEGSEADTSSRQRWEIWHVAREIAADNQLFGVGLGAYSRAHGRHTYDSPEYALSEGYRDAHSTYLSILAETGWPGLIIFLSMIGISLKTALSARRRLAPLPRESGTITVLAVALIGFMAAGIFATYVHLSFLYLHLALLYAVGQAGHRTPGVHDRIGRSRVRARSGDARSGLTRGGLPAFRT
jgi:putative inorganic carbon (hco3(-)) transporter